MKLIWKLLRQHISIAQFTGFVLANLTGMVIILLGIQFYSDTQAIYNGEDSFMRSDYLIINKQVGTLSGLTGGSTAFSDDEVEEISSQPFVKNIGCFTSSAFRVRASFSIDQLTSFSTDMFFESVPDEFVDIKSQDWTFSEGQRNIPIILPKNYLDLYNFGYAQTKSLPKLSEGILGALSLDITIYGSGTNEQFNGKIAGFSSRLNTILVPEAFMHWANEKFSDREAAKASRIIMEVNNPADDEITTYLQDNGYETDQSKLDASKTTYLLKVVMGIVMSVGLIICVLAFYILMLSVFLLVEKNSQKLENLLLIGYSPTKVAMPYQVLTIGLNVIVLIIALAIMICVRGIYLDLFLQFFPDMEVPSSWQAMVVGGVLMLLVSFVNIFTIYHKVVSIWKRKN